MAREKVFRFKQFSVRNDKSAMKVGTDGVLLGAWVDVTNSKQILDIGTGTGLIALMLAQRCDANIDAIEIDDDAVSEATLNFNNSPWEERLAIIHSDFVDFAEKTDKKYDIIVSNPPYFVNSLECPNEKRCMARHTNSLSYNELINGASKLLSDFGTLFLITPSDVEILVKEIIGNVNLFVNEIVYVFPTVGSMAKRLMWKITKINRECVSKKLIIEKERHVYTDDYIDLTHDYYINM